MAAPGPYRRAVTASPPDAQAPPTASGRRGRAGTLALGLLVFAAGSPAAAPAQEAGAPLLAAASAALEELAARDGTPRSRQALLLHNLTRYFVTYLVPSGGDELARVLGTVERMTRAAAREIYRAADATARQAGAARIGAEHVDAVIGQAVPSEATPYKERLFFPDRPAGSRVPLEQIDLDAFADAGVQWEVVASLAADGALPEGALAMEPEAVERFADGVNAYGLLLLRVGGRLAREARDPHLASHHLRRAGRVLGGREGPAEEGAPGPPAGPVPFTDVTAESGLRFRHVSSDWVARFRRYGHDAPTFSGGGVTAGDLDGDRWPDLIFCGGAGCAAFRNRRDGTFEKMTAASAIEVDGEARMAVLADLDNDGKRDLFVTYARDTNRLFRGLGGGRFEEATAGSGLERQGDVSGPAAALDYDGDGLLDLYVGNFGNYLAGESPFSPTDSRNGQPNRLYRNRGGLRFEETTEAAGVGDTGWTQALSHFDHDLDGDQDLYVANDFGRNELFVNRGDGTFRRGAEASGSDDRYHGMNVAFADLNRDGYGDLFVTNIWFWNSVKRATTESNTLLISEPGEAGVTYRRSEDAGFLAEDTGWAWGALFLDVENDGDDDLYIANGFTDYLTFIQNRPHPERPDEVYPINNGREPNRLFLNRSGMPYDPVPSGAELGEVNSRGVALLDFDRDGDLDLAVSTFHSEARLFRNDAGTADRHWLSVELVGDPERGTSLDAIGTQVIARGSDGLYVWRSRTGGEGYLSMSEPSLGFGLGEATAVDLEIFWPGGERQKIEGVPADRRIRVRQGAGGFETLP